MNHNETDTCPICKHPIETIIKWFQTTPYIDGHNYNTICYRCASIIRYIKTNPKTHEQTWIKEGYIGTTQDLINDGWTKQEAQWTTKATQHLQNHPKITGTTTPILEALFLNKIP